MSQKTWEFSDEFKVKCIYTKVFLNEINCKHHLISITVHGRRHSKLFTNFHVLWDTLYFELKERKKTTIILVFTCYMYYVNFRFISFPRPIFNQLGQDVQYNSRLRQTVTVHSFYFYLEISLFNLYQKLTTHFMGLNFPDICISFFTKIITDKTFI